MPSEQERDFYKELDRHNREKSQPKRFTLTKLAIIFVLALVLVESTLFFVGRSLKKVPVADATTPSTSFSFSDGFSRVDLNDKQYQIIISEGTLCGKIYSSFKRDLKCQISSDGILVGGKISSVLPSNASIIFIPKVSNGSLDFEVEKATVGSVKVPSFLTYGIKNVFKAVINEQTRGITVEKVDLETSIMVIVAGKTL